MSTSTLLLRVDGDRIFQNAHDLRGIDPILARSAAAITNLAGPRFYESFLEVTPGARRYGATQVYRPLPGGKGGFSSARYAHAGAEGYGFSVGPKGSIWGVSIKNPSGERFLTHLAGPQIWPKEIPETELSQDGWPRRDVAPDGAVFTVGQKEGKDVVYRQISGELLGASFPVPAIPDILRQIGFSLDALSADRAVLFGSWDGDHQKLRAGAYAAVFDGRAWSEVIAPPARRFDAFCQRADGTQWAIAHLLAAEETSSRGQIAEREVLVRAGVPNAPWERVSLPAGISASAVVCGDARAVWVVGGDANDTVRGVVVLRSRPVENPVEVVLEDSPLDGHLRFDVEPSYLAISASPPQAATSACPLDQLWAVLAREGGRLAWHEIEEPSKDPRARAAQKAKQDETRRNRWVRAREGLATATLPEGTTLETFGADRERWIGARMPSYAAGRALVDATIVRLPDERPKLLCASPDKRRPYRP